MLELGSDLWVFERPLRLLGVASTTRMTVVRLPSGVLWVHSPIDVRPEQKVALDARGPVRFVVAPNRLHHLFAGKFLEAYPEARLWAAPGLREKRPDLPVTAVLGDEAPPEWAGSMEQVHIPGNSWRNEVVFFHPASRTLVVTDLLEAVSPDAPPFVKQLARATGYFPQPGPSPDFRLTRLWASVLRPALTRIAAWDFDRIVLAHGDLVLTRGKAVFERAFGGWL